jgi:hypothetical protein
LFIYDALSLIANTIDRHNLVDIILAAPSVSCKKDTSWLFGSEFMKFLKMSSFHGLSGYIEFDQLTGYRKNITLSIVDRTKKGVDLVGYWRDLPKGESIQIVRSFSKEKDQILDKLDRHLNVTTKLVRSTFIFQHKN